MSDPKTVPAEVPEEVRLVMAHLKPEPETLTEEREQLLAELGTLMASSREPLLGLLGRMRGVLLSTRPGAPFEPRFAREFTAALEQYRKDPAALKPPELLIDCLIFLRELVQARGLGPLLEAVDEVKDLQQVELRTRIKLGNTRG